VDYVGKSSVSENTLNKIKQTGGKALGVDARISNADDVKDLIAQTVNTFGKLDIFVNNARIEKKIAFPGYRLDEWQKIVAVNLTRPVPVLSGGGQADDWQDHGGRIINISSVHEDLPMLTNAPYCATKGGVRMLMRTIAVELAPHKITVSNIGPGQFPLPLIETLKAMRR
jgi:glucose 1-dehydrogenase